LVARGVLAAVSDTVLVPGGRDVRASLDDAGGDACVVACPPHPQHRGHRGDERLVAVGDALGERGVDCLRFDYGAWDGGRGERADAGNALDWAADRYDRVGLFGFSFGGAVALLAAADRTDLAAVSALAPAAGLGDDPDLDAAAAVGAVACPLQVVYGSRDETADWEPVVAAARERNAEVVELSADHFFVGRAPTVGERVVAFLVERL